MTSDVIVMVHHIGNFQVFLGNYYYPKTMTNDVVVIVHHIAILKCFQEIITILNFVYIGCLTLFSVTK